MKATPAPWRRTVSNSGRHLVSGQHGEQVAALWNSSQREANARLIQYAPDMRDLLQDLAGQFVCNCGHKSCRIEEQRREIDALLALVEGSVCN
jgi:hypothetical protein